MEEASKNSRRFSNSTVSDVTVNSSVMSIIARENFSPNNGINENFNQDLSPTQNNVKIESSSGIRVGDVIYNIYSPAPPAESEFKSCVKYKINIY